MVVVDLYAFSPPFHGFFHTAYVTAPSVRNSSGLHALPAGRCLDSGPWVIREAFVLPTQSPLRTKFFWREKSSFPKLT